MPIFQLTEDLIFPNPELADVSGIIAVGGDLSTDRLLLAYKKGIFPWFNPDDPILWWSPDPRLVLFPNELKISRSMRPYFNQRKFDLTIDKDFLSVILNCKQHRRKGQRGGTWITGDMVAAYKKLHELGYAHSVEIWQEGELVGGLYGIALGKVFFGESMFAKTSNASKFGFIYLVQILKDKGFELIDCQQETDHLERLGARAISRKTFLKLLQKNETNESYVGNWGDFIK